MKVKALKGKINAGNPHVRFDEGEVASTATPRRGSLLYKNCKNERRNQMGIRALVVCSLIAISLLAIGCCVLYWYWNQMRGPSGFAIACAKPDLQIIERLLSDDPHVRYRANSEVQEAIDADMHAFYSNKNVVEAHISWGIGKLFPDRKHEKAVAHKGSIREFIIRSAASCGWWPCDLNPNTIHCRIYSMHPFGPTVSDCEVNVTYDEDTDTIDFIVVGHEYRGNFERDHCSQLFNRLTGKTEPETGPGNRRFESENRGFRDYKK